MSGVAGRSLMECSGRVAQHLPWHATLLLPVQHPAAQQRQATRHEPASIAYTAYAGAHQAAEPHCRASICLAPAGQSHGVTPFGPRSFYSFLVATQHSAAGQVAEMAVGPRHLYADRIRAKMPTRRAPG